MPISHEHKLIYMHIPKTGGTALYKFFNFQEQGHYNLKYLSLRYKNLSNYYWFLIVRNPWDRFASAFFYAKLPKSYWHNKDNHTIHTDYNTLKNVSFNECIKLLYNKKIVLRSYHFVPMANLLNDQVKFNKIIKYENFHSDISELCKELKLNVDINNLKQVINSSERTKPYTTLYTEETKQMIAELYKKDIELFSYTFEV